MIFKIVELPYMDQPKEVITHIPVFLPSPNLELVGIGSECGFLSDEKPKIKHFMIHELFGSHLFIHDLVNYKDQYFPISTKWRNKSGTTKKVYTGSIFDLLEMGDRHEFAYFHDLPKTPFDAVVTNLELFLQRMEMGSFADLKREQALKISPRALKFTPELYLLMEKLPSSLIKEVNSGYLDDDNNLLRMDHILHTVKEMVIDPKPSNGSRRLDTGNVDELISMLLNLKNAKLPFEDNFCFNKKNFADVMKDSAIYYPKEPSPIIKKTSIAFDVEDRFDNFGFTFPIINFLRFCDLLPETCKVIFINNKCVKFDFSDDSYPDFWFNLNPNLFNRTSTYPINFGKKVKDTFRNLLSDLLAMMRLRTGLNEYDYPTLVVEKIEGNVLKLTLIDKNGKEKSHAWDLTMLTIGAPEQYGIEATW